MGPLLFAPMSEVYGRRIVYIPTWLLFCAFQIGCATAQNIETLLICRFFVGMFGSPSLTVAGGTMSDIWLRTVSLIYIVLEDSANKCII